MLKQQKGQNSQQSNPAPKTYKPAEKPVEKPAELPQVDLSQMPQSSDDDETDENETEDEKEQEQQAPEQIEGTEQQKDTKEARIQAILEEIEMLQNNGRFRAEMLHQLQEIKQALVVIAGVLVDLPGNDKK